MAKNTKGSFQMTCPLSNTDIDSDLCIEVQECIDGNFPVTLELEDANSGQSERLFRN